MPAVEKWKLNFSHSERRWLVGLSWINFEIHYASKLTILKDELAENELYCSRRKKSSVVFFIDFCRDAWTLNKY